ncbi:MAG: FAD-binding protein [Dehalococcoidales bacterium]
MEDAGTIACDVLVIGSGGAGLRAAIAAKEAGADVLLVTKSRVNFNSNTLISAGLFAEPSGWYDSQDNPEIHTRDTLAGGRFIGDRKLISVVSNQIGRQVAFLEKCGVKLVAQRAGPDITVSPPPGHSFPRHIRSEGNNGRDFIVPLNNYARKIGVRYAEKVLITRLFTTGGRFAAASGITGDNRFLSFQAKCLILATGGFAQIYLNNDNAASATGDGLALAAQLGIPLRDMEFVQFYPTATGKRGNRIVLYEGLIGRGAKFRNSIREDILAKSGLLDRKSMTRDRITRALMSEIIDGKGVDGGILLDLSSVPGSLPKSLTSLTGKEHPEPGMFVVTPTAHFCMGGIIISESAETEVPGVYGAGEICTGVHGANRLAGNSLAEIFSIGEIAGNIAALKALDTNNPAFPEGEVVVEKARLESLILTDGQKTERLSSSLKEVMWQKAGIIRQGSDLKEAILRIEELKLLSAKLEAGDSRGLIKSLEFKNMLLLSEMVCRAALLREESRGAHYRNDHPQEETAWLKNIIIHSRDTGIALKTVKADPEIVTAAE